MKLKWENARDKLEWWADFVVFLLAPTFRTPKLAQVSVINA